MSELTCTSSCAMNLATITVDTVDVSLQTLKAALLAKISEHANKQASESNCNVVKRTGMLAAYGLHCLTATVRAGGVVGSPYTNTTKSDFRELAIAELRHANTPTAVLFVLLKLAANVRALNNNDNMGYGTLLPAAESAIKGLVLMFPCTFDQFKEESQWWLGILQQAFKAQADAAPITAANNFLRQGMLPAYEASVSSPAVSPVTLNSQRLVRFSRVSEPSSTGGVVSPSQPTTPSGMPTPGNTTIMPRRSSF